MDKEVSLPPLINKEEFERALEEKRLVHLLVICRDLVILPEGLKTPEWKALQDAVHLEYGLNMANPITDLVVSETGVAATLSFDYQPHYTYVPWQAVVGVALEGPMVESSPEPSSSPKRKNFLKLVP